MVMDLRGILVQALFETWYLLAIGRIVEFPNESGSAFGQEDFRRNPAGRDFEESG